MVCSLSIGIIGLTFDIAIINRIVAAVPYNLFLHVRIFFFGFFVPRRHFYKYRAAPLSIAQHLTVVDV